MRGLCKDVRWLGGDQQVWTDERVCNEKDKHEDEQMDKFMRSLSSLGPGQQA